MNFPDSMPRDFRRDDAILNEQGEPVPPPQQSGTAGSDEETWLAGKPIAVTEGWPMDGADVPGAANGERTRAQGEQGDQPTSGGDSARQ